MIDTDKGTQRNTALALFFVVSFMVAMMQEYVPASTVQRLLTGRGLRGNIVGAGLGAVTPFCSCSTIPVTVGLLNAGAPFGATMSFLVSSPILNPVILGLLVTLFGWKFTVFYGAASFVLAVAVGAVSIGIGTEAGAALAARACAGRAARKLGLRVVAVTRTGRTAVPVDEAFPVSRIAEKNWPPPFMAETVTHIARRFAISETSGRTSSPAAREKVIRTARVGASNTSTSARKMSDSVMMPTST